MQKKAGSDQSFQSPRPTNRIDYILDDHRKLAIPVGPHFQANIPDWTTQNKEKYAKGDHSDSSKWLGTQVWTPKRSSLAELNKDIGKGRPDFCPCEFPGSIECIIKHVTEKRAKLQVELGPAFWRWKFNEMGEDAAKLWTLEEQKKFDSIVKMNPISEGESFLNPALESLPSQNRRSIVNYYFNCYVPRRISLQIRSGCRIIDTDDEGPEEGPKSKSSRKRCQADTVTSQSSKLVKARYLTGRR